ncbi:MAG: L,D-transpeptidase [Deltaproteobacteria bacterium]|nr:L,D-transpeptidase [Deltaproteobacteria bacterium]
MAPRHILGSKPPKGRVRNRRQSAAADSSRRSPSRAKQGNDEPRSRGATGSGSKHATALGAVLGVAVGAGALGAVAWASGCGNEAPPPGPSAAAGTGSTDPFSSLPTPPAMPDDSNAPVVAEPDLPDAGVPDKPYEGPWLGALAQATPIYPTARFSRNRLGYIRRGGKVPATDKPIRTASCKQGFYPLVDGGYVCGKYATLNTDDPRVKMGVKPPDMDALLPYKYAYNTKHGTPLYLSVPSREEMLIYEPYLVEKEKKKTKKQRQEEAEKEAESSDRPRPNVPASSASAAAASASASGMAGAAGGAPTPPAAADGGAADGAPPDKPWWQKKKDGTVNVTLAELEEGDGTLSRRMVKGFFIAVDRTFGWNNRLWYKTTEGLIAPTDRMIIPKTPEMDGLAVVSSEFTQVGFIRAAKARKYDVGEEGKTPKRMGKVARFTAIGLTGDTRLHDKKRYRRTVDGWWMRDRDGTWTDPGPRPSEVGDDDKWVDVNLSRKTLMAFVGEKPVYASLISPGKRSKVKKKDHRTKTGKWRVREKHITTTMDGDGPGGDLPYSIQDVPYVQYYDGSYALHGAFWHHNFGREQSHGCVNLPPAVAKHLFFWTDPPLPRGWHGVWASSKRKGTLIVIHE